MIADLDATLQRRLHVAGVRLLDKRGVWHQRAIANALRILSGGLMNRYLSSFVTTIGRTIYLPSDFGHWPRPEREAILRHELVHVAQFERWGLVPMALAYVLLPLPIGLAWCRMRLEREAYEESLRAAYENGGRPAVEAMRTAIISRFTSADYLWMWPCPRALARWFDSFVDALEHGADAH